MTSVISLQSNNIEETHPKILTILLESPSLLVDHLQRLLNFVLKFGKNLPCSYSFFVDLYFVIFYISFCFLFKPFRPSVAFLGSMSPFVPFVSRELLTAQILSTIDFVHKLECEVHFFNTNDLSRLLNVKYFSKSSKNQFNQILISVRLNYLIFLGS